jgi:hypothetical protein
MKAIEFDYIASDIEKTEDSLDRAMLNKIVTIYEMNGIAITPKVWEGIKRDTIGAEAKHIHEVVEILNRMEK